MIYTNMVEPSSQVLDRIRPIESESFGSAGEMFKIRDKQSSTREYTLRQTYSFLEEMSSSETPIIPLTLTSPPIDMTHAKPLRKTTARNDTWSPPSKKVASNKSSQSEKNPTEVAR